jgi:hypothetical protein
MLQDGSSGHLDNLVFLHSLPRVLVYIETTHSELLGPKAGLNELHHPVFSKLVRLLYVLLVEFNSVGS